MSARIDDLDARVSQHEADLDELERRADEQAEDMDSAGATFADHHAALSEIAGGWVRIAARLAAVEACVASLLEGQRQTALLCAELAERLARVEGRR